MSKRSAPIYPAYTFNESRTWFNWVKLTAAEVHGLKEQPGFEGQNIYFHLNHPIRYVCLTGLVVSIEDKVKKYALVELDDGSGMIMTIKITRLADDITSTIDCPSNTTIANVDVVSSLGNYDIHIDKQVLEIGTVVKAKGTISTFRNLRQIELKRIWIVRSTAEEMAEWVQGAKFKGEVLSKPWVLSQEQLKNLQKSEMQKRHKREEAARMEEKRLRHDAAKKVRRAERRKEHDLKKEARRKQEEDIMNTGAII